MPRSTQNSSVSTKSVARKSVARKSAPTKPVASKRTLATKPLLETAHEAIRRDILNCHFPPGSYVSEPELTKHYNLGRSAVRGALNRLSQEQLVVNIPQVGYKVADVTLKDVQELFAARAMMETYTAAEAARNAKPNQLEQLQSLAQIGMEIGNDASVATYLSANMDFHMLVADIAGNTYVTQLLTTLMYRMERIHYIIHRLTSDSHLVNDGGHELLVKSFQENNSELAKETMYNHVMTSRTMALDLLSRSPNLQSVNLAASF
jgi:DNA-binding GntR family transcriptional regulator